MARAPEIIIVVDTSATFDDVMFSRTRWMQLLSLCARGKVRVAIPIVVLRETARHWEKQANKALKAARERYGRALRGRKVFADLGLGDLAEPPRVPDVAIDRMAFHKGLAERLASVGVEILPLPKVGVPEILDRDLDRRKPFAESGKGFRDVLIWHSVIELLSGLTRNDTVYFVTNNTGDYCKEGNLDPDLLSEIDPSGAGLKHVTTLAELVERDVMRPLVSGLVASDEELETFLQAAMELEVGYFEPTIGDLVREELELAAKNLVNEEIQTGIENGYGLDFSEIAIPDQIESPTIVHVEADPKTVDWDAYETYEEDTLLIRASIDADVDIQGFVYKADYHGMEDEVSVIEFDWNEHMAFVGTSVEARLVFQLRIEADAGMVEGTEFEAAEGLTLLGGQER